MRATAIVFFLIPLAIACDDAATDPTSNAGTLEMIVQANIGAAAVAEVSVEVTGPGIGVAIVENLTVNDGLATGSLIVPTGSDRTFTVRGFDESGVETHRGTVTTSISTGTDPVISISANPLTQEISIEIIFQAYFVTVVPGLDTLAAGDSVYLTATISDASGNEVHDSNVLWASSNPAVVSVHSSGWATGKRAGSAAIVANALGVAGAATVVVE